MGTGRFSVVFSFLFSFTFYSVCLPSGSAFAAGGGVAAVVRPSKHGKGLAGDFATAVAIEDGVVHDFGGDLGSGEDAFAGGDDARGGAPKDELDASGAVSSASSVSPVDLDTFRASVGENAAAALLQPSVGKVKKVRGRQKAGKVADAALQGVDKGKRKLEKKRRFVEFLYQSKKKEMDGLRKVAGVKELARRRVYDIKDDATKKIEDLRFDYKSKLIEVEREGLATDGVGGKDDLPVLPLPVLPAAGDAANAVGEVASVSKADDLMGGDAAAAAGEPAAAFGAGVLEAGLPAGFDRAALKKKVAQEVGLIGKEALKEVKAVRQETKNTLAGLYKEYGLVPKNTIALDFAAGYIFSGGVPSSFFTSMMTPQQQGAMMKELHGHAPNGGSGGYFSFSGGVTYVRKINQFLSVVVGVGARGYNNELLVHKGNVPKPDIAVTNIFAGIGFGLMKKGPFILTGSFGAGLSYLGITMVKPLNTILGQEHFYGVGVAFNLGLTAMFLVNSKQTLSVGASGTFGPAALYLMHDELGLIYGGNFDFTHRFAIARSFDLYYKLYISIIEMNSQDSAFEFTNYLVGTSVGCAFKF